jgi:hypothetical protein
VAVEDVAREDRLHVVRRRVEVGQLDRGAETGQRGEHGVAVGAGRDVAREVGRDLRLEHGLRPAADGARGPGVEQSRVGQEPDERPLEGQLPHGCRRAEAELPADRPLAAFEPLRAQPQLPAHTPLDPLVAQSSNTSSGPGIA